MQKGFVGVVILIAALILAGLAGAYYFGVRKESDFQKRLSYQNPVIFPSTSPQLKNKSIPETKPSNVDETANWKIYASKYGYLLKYPPEWGAMESVGSKGVSVWSKPEYLELSEKMVMGFDKEDYASISVGIYSYDTSTAAGVVSKGTDIEKFVKDMFGLYTFKSSQKISLDGKPADLVTFRRMVLKPQFDRPIQNCPLESEPCFIESGITKGVWLHTEQGIMFISYSYGRQYEEADTVEDVFEKILSSFRFLDENSANDIVYWKTHTNPRLGIMFKYPPNGNIMDIKEGDNVLFITNDTSKPYYIFNLQIKGNKQKFTLRQFIDNELTMLRNSGSPGSDVLADKRESTIKDYQKGDIKGLYMRGGADGDSVSDFIEVITEYNNKIYKFTVDNGDGSVDEFQKELIDQILSTFKFIP